MIARFLTMSVVLALGGGLAPIGAVSVPAGATCTTSPRFDASFVQPALIDEWSDAQLAEEFGILDDACMTTQVLQWTADSKDQTSVYPSGLSGYTSSTSTDVVGRLLTAADTAGSSVVLGLQTDADWFDLGVSDQAWLDAQADVSTSLADDLVAQYGAHASLAGWYLPFEVDNLNFPTSTEWDRLGAFYAEIVDHLHTLTPGLPVVIAPFYNNDLAGTITPAVWQSMWESVLDDAAIDVIALQDGIGAGHATVADLPAWFSATRAAIDAARPATRLFSDAETFEFGPGGLQPRGLSGVVDALDAVSAYVDGYWSFSYDHYQSPQTVSAVYHATYLDYLATGAVDAIAPGAPTSLTATASGPQGIDLTWAASTDAIGVAGYRILRDGDLVAVSHGSATSWSDTQLDGSTSYSYAVQAFDGAGNVSASSTTATATTSADPTYADTWSTGAGYTATVAANASYPDTDGAELTDGVRGAALYGDAWQGRNAPGTYSFTVDLGALRPVGSVETGWLQVRDDYVFLPPSVRIELSTDGVSYTLAGTITTPAVSDAIQVKDYRLLGLTSSARYVRVTVDGGTAWTMLDEILVRG